MLNYKLHEKEWQKKVTIGHQLPCIKPASCPHRRFEKFGMADGMTHESGIICNQKNNRRITERESNP